MKKFIIWAAVLGLMGWGMVSCTGHMITSAHSELSSR